MAQEVSIDLHERLVKTAAEFAQGTTTYAGRKSAWHALGAVVGKFATWQELVKAAKADFTVVKKQLEYLGVPIDAYGIFRVDRSLQDELNNAVKLGAGLEALDAIRRKAIFLASATGSYQVIQHTDGFQVLDRLVGEINGAHYETMGTLDRGRIVWGQVDPNVKIRVGDDESDVLLTFRTSHDGSISFEIYETIHRIVCRNTFRAAHLRRLSNALKVRHTKNAERRIESLKAEIGEIKDEALSMQERLNRLASRRVTKESMVDILDRLFPKTKEADTGEEKSTKHRDGVLAQVLSLYENNDGDAFPEQRGTLYNLLNAVTEFTDHVRSTKGNEAGQAIVRAESSQFGSGAKLKNEALEIITEAAKTAPEVLKRGGGTMMYDPSLFAKV